MKNDISSFAKIEEPERMVFIAKLHHAMWYNEALFKRVKYMLEHINDELPAAEYFPPHPATQDI